MLGVCRLPLNMGTFFPHVRTTSAMKTRFIRPGLVFIRVTLHHWLVWYAPHWSDCQHWLNLRVMPAFSSAPIVWKGQRHKNRIPCSQSRIPRSTATGFAFYKLFEQLTSFTSHHSNPTHAGLPAAWFMFFSLRRPSLLPLFPVRCACITCAYLWDFMCSCWCARTTCVIN